MKKAFRFPLNLQTFGEEDKKEDKPEKKEEIPQWAKDLQSKVDALTAGGGDKSGAQQIPGVNPPPEDKKDEQPAKPAAESKKSKSFLDWLMG